MKKKFYNVLFLVGMAILLINGAATQSSSKTYDTKAALAGNLSFQRGEDAEGGIAAVFEIIALEAETLEEKMLRAEEAANETEIFNRESREPIISSETVEYEEEYYSIVDGINKNGTYNGNIVGYSFLRSRDGDKWYSREPDYLLPEDLVGKGIYVSEHLCEIEVFLGQKLEELLADRGKIREEDRQYYTDWAVEQLGDTDWELLDEKWRPDPFSYDRHYRQAVLSRIGQYEFSYYFIPRQESMAGSETQEVSMSLLVDKKGMICEIKTRIYSGVVSQEVDTIEDSVNETGLYDDRYSETIIHDGEIEEGKVMIDFSAWYDRKGFTYETHEEIDASIKAGELAEIYIDMLESLGEHGARYKDDSYSEHGYSDFLNQPWKQMDENWKASGKYSCEYIDDIYDSALIHFRYYFYPDYEKMGTDKAQAVIIQSTHSYDGFTVDRVQICAIYELSKEEYESRVKPNMTKVVDAGKVSGDAESISVPIPWTVTPHVLLSEYTFDREEDAGVTHMEKEIWGYSEVPGLAGYLGEKLRADIKIEYGLDYGYYHGFKVSWDLDDFFERAGENWEAGSDYDCFYIKEKERAGCIQLRYYFYPQESESEREWVLVLDAFVSEDGIEDMVVNSYVRKAGCRLF